MKTYNQFLETPFSEEVKPPEPPEPQEEDPGIKSKEKRQMQIKKMVLLKKLQAVRAGAGADIVAGYEPEGEDLKEYSPNVTYQAKGGKKSGKLGKSSVYSLRGKDESKKDFRKSQVKDIKGGYLITEEVVDEEKISAFEFVKRQIEKDVGKSGYVSKDNPRKPQSAADKAKARAHQAKVDKENAAARAKDPSQGRYPKG